MSTLKIHGFPQSTYVRTACMTCREKGVDYEVVPLAFGEPSHAAIHPFLKMPALDNGSVKLFETMAIACYVDEAFDGLSLQPADPIGRARMHQWISAANDYFYPDLVGAELGGGAATDEVLDRADKDLLILDAALSEGAYLAGPTVSLADLFVAPMIAYGCAQGTAANMVDAKSNLAAWRDRMFRRDSFKATRA